MSEIPDDIDKIATALVLKTYADADEPEFDAYLDTARAILAERERAAKIIEAECARVLAKQDGKMPDVDQMLRMISVLLPGLAAAIRTPPTGEEQ